MTSARRSSAGLHAVSCCWCRPGEHEPARQGQSGLHAASCVVRASADCVIHDRVAGNDDVGAAMGKQSHGDNAGNLVVVTFQRVGVGDAQVVHVDDPVAV